MNQYIVSRMGSTHSDTLFATANGKTFAIIIVRNIVHERTGPRIKLVINALHCHRSRRDCRFEMALKI